MFKFKQSIFAVSLVIVAAALSACSSSSSSDGAGAGGFGVPGSPGIDIRMPGANECHDLELSGQMSNPFGGQLDVQQKMVEAIRHGDAACVKLAIQKGAKANVKVDTDLFPRGNNNTWAIHYALEDSCLFFAKDTKNIGVVRALVEAGADLEAQNSRGQTVLQASLTGETLGKYPAVATYVVSTRKANLEVWDGAGDTPLLGLLKVGNKQIAQMLVAGGANIQARTKSGQTTLQLAINAKFEDVAIGFVNHGVDPSVPDSNGNNSVHAAATQNMGTLMTAILSKNVDVNRRNNARETAFLLAVRNNANGIAKALIAKGADVNLASDTGAPIHSALRLNNAELINILIPAVSDINIRNNESSTPLLLATQFASAEQVRAILNRGADANLADNSKRTPLMYALESKQAEKTTDLVKKSQVNQKGPGGMTAAFFAASTADLQALLAYGADLNVRADSGVSVLSKSIRENNTDIAKFLIANGADVQWRSLENKSTLLHSAISNNNTTIARALLDRGVDANAVNVDGQTPLFHVYSVPAVDLLVEYKADVNRLSLEKESALVKKVEQFALQKDKGIWEVVVRLVALRADVNAKTAKGSSLLHIAVSSRDVFGRKPEAQTALVELLISNKANVNATDAARNTPLHVADTDAEVQLLLNADANTKALNLEKQTPLQLQNEILASYKLAVDTVTARIKELEQSLSESVPGGANQAVYKKRIEDARRELNELVEALNIQDKIVALLI